MIVQISEWLTDLQYVPTDYARYDWTDEILSYNGINIITMDENTSFHYD